MGSKEYMIMFGITVLGGLIVLWIASHANPPPHPPSHTYPAPGIGRYVTIASEGHSFSVPSDTLVRYGAVSDGVGRWVEKVFKSHDPLTSALVPYICNNNTFGFDPYPKVPKECQTYVRPGIGL